MNRYCDLHTHSVYSDGSYTPGELIEEAEVLGLSAIALCDHNTADGLPHFLRAAEGKKIKAVAGVEFSADLDGNELHLLGLYVKEKYFSQVTELMNGVLALKEESNLALIESLKGAGIFLDYGEIKAKTPNGRVNRAHIAAALTEKGYVTSIKEAFRSYLSKSGGFYTEPRRLTIWELIDFIISIDALPVLAHPLLNLEPKELSELLPKAKAAGLRGMECLYSEYRKEEIALSMELTRGNGLLPSGGSDFHGTNKPHISLGRGKGDLFVPAEWERDLSLAIGVIQ